MSTLAAAINVTQRDQGYEGFVSSDFDFMVPNGGYLAGIALAAAANEASLPWPASLHCHYLRPAAHGPVEVDVETTRKGNVVEIMRVSLSQGGKAILVGSVTFAAHGLEGFAHDASVAPAVPRPDQLRPFDVLAENFSDWYPIWRHVEGRPVIWPDPGNDPTATWRTWLRLRDGDKPTPEAVAASVMVYADLAPFYANIAAHSVPSPWLAPSLDLYIQFHRLPGAVDWLLADSTAGIARDGLVGSVTRIWSTAGELVATAGAQLLSRPNPVYAAQLAEMRGAA